MEVGIGNSHRGWMEVGIGNYHTSWTMDIGMIGMSSHHYHHSLRDSSLVGEMGIGHS